MHRSTQIGAASALVELLTEHPSLSDHMGWSISRFNPHLIGFVYGGRMDILAKCATALGGSIRAGHLYDSHGEQMRQHILSATWRNVPVEVLLSVPEPARIHDHQAVASEAALDGVR